MTDLSLAKVAIKGATLASILHRTSAAPTDVDGLLFGHVTSLSALPTDDTDISSATTTHVATVTNFSVSGAAATNLYDSTGQLNTNSLTKLTTTLGGPHSLLGWFVSRRRTPLRPSMREHNVSVSLSAKFPSCPLVFIVFTTSPSDYRIHTHEHKAFRFMGSRRKFEAMSVEIVNVGPAFRPHYEEFRPNSRFELMPCGESGVGMELDGDGNEEESGKMANLVEGDDGKLKKLVGAEASGYTSALEDLYVKMISKMENLSKRVEESNALVLEQEARNAKLKHKFVTLD